MQLSNPTSFGSGFYSGRIFVSYSIPNRTYFGDFSTAPLLEDPNELTIDICSTMISESSTRNSSIDGNYDMMNFMWYYGDESLFQNSSGDIYLLTKVSKILSRSNLFFIRVFGSKPVSLFDLQSRILSRWQKLCDFVFCK